ncbi:unnamed protein product [Amoebophrya sp. A120]|nr:unnamed protein product [Amoebophrya sp. A120]|eukprot:GSA120T00014802001.1
MRARIAYEEKMRRRARKESCREVYFLQDRARSTTKLQVQGSSSYNIAPGGGGPQQSSLFASALAKSRDKTTTIGTAAQNLFESRILTTSSIFLDATAVGNLHEAKAERLRMMRRRRRRAAAANKAGVKMALDGRDNVNAVDEPGVARSSAEMQRNYEQNHAGDNSAVEGGNGTAAATGATTSLKQADGVIDETDEDEELSGGTNAKNTLAGSARTVDSRASSSRILQPISLPIDEHRTAVLGPIKPGSGLAVNEAPAATASPLSGSATYAGGGYLDDNVTTAFSPGKKRKSPPDYEPVVFFEEVLSEKTVKDLLEFQYEQHNSTGTRSDLVSQSECTSATAAKEHQLQNKRAAPSAIFAAQPVLSSDEEQEEDELGIFDATSHEHQLYHGFYSQRAKTKSTTTATGTTTSAAEKGGMWTSNSDASAGAKISSHPNANNQGDEDEADLYITEATMMSKPRQLAPPADVVTMQNRIDGKAFLGRKDSASIDLLMNVVEQTTGTANTTPIWSASDTEEDSSRDLLLAGEGGPTVVANKNHGFKRSVENLHGAAPAAALMRRQNYEHYWPPSFAKSYPPMVTFLYEKMTFQQLQGLSLKRASVLEREDLLPCAPKKRSCFIQSTSSLPYDKNDSGIKENATIVESRYLQLHLFVLVHGFQGNHYDMRCIKNLLSLSFPEAVFLLSSCNESRMLVDSIETMGVRLAQEVQDYIEEFILPNNADVASSNGINTTRGMLTRNDYSHHYYRPRLSFIGHSLGGLIIRAALPHLMARAKNPTSEAGEQQYAGTPQHPFYTFHSYISLSTPHLGISRQVKATNLIKTGLWLLQQMRGNCKCLQELSMEDGTSGNNYEDCYLFRLCGEPPRCGMESADGDKDTKHNSQLPPTNPLHVFTHVLFVSSFQDTYAPYESARVQVGREDDEDHVHTGGTKSTGGRSSSSDGALVAEMARRIFGVEQQASTTTLVPEMKETSVKGRISCTAPCNTNSANKKPNFYRADVSFAFPDRTLDTFVGRAAHIQFLENVCQTEDCVSIITIFTLTVTRRFCMTMRTKK